ncbi:hypothetical protein F511_03528 [Dorcoceras hygrometricum]|uniref:Insecticidal crystal toxin domain-containing protein n=1 Tax=Dorcoceras hygrometricum TaxID=472368 RepID=A0A2Z7AH89_9LAMI|nr:hypothetical protein F511_03528 [Dorcoceras hygrometricum]
MYVTRPLSKLRGSPGLLSETPEGPNSGFLVIQDEESETYCCFGLCKTHTLEDLPFPQNKELTVRYTTGSGETQTTTLNPVFLIPILNQPLYLNRYYAIVPHGKRKGEAFTCSTEEDKVTCCFCRCVKDVKPRPFDPRNIYQQIEIVPYELLCSSRGQFVGNSVASDGFPPSFFRRKGWSIRASTPKHFELGEAQGLDGALRARLPQLSSSISEPVVVGKWYCPFIFVKEGSLRDQVERSMYYEITLEQRWERIFSSQTNGGNSVAIDLVLEREEVFVNGNKGVLDERNAADGVVWFTSSGNLGGETSFGLRVEVLQRMKWEQERGGWIGGEDKEAKIKKTEDFKEGGEWREFGCYVLVERFKLKRLDGSLAMEYDFKQLHQIKSLWE